MTPTQAPLLAHRNADNGWMPRHKLDAKHILAANLKKLMDRPGTTDPNFKRFSTYQVAGHRKGENARGALSARTVGRIRNAQVDATLDHIQAIAAFFVLEPWQLLVPNFDPADPPHLAFTLAEKEAYERMEKSRAALNAIHGPPAESQP